MKKSFFIITAFLLIIITNSCNKNKNRFVIAEKIEYDVPIITNDPELDWWVQNIEGSKREAFLKKIASALNDGKLKAYDYSTDKLLTKEQLKKFIDISNNKSPDSNNILNSYKLRFTEKWSINTKTLEFDKKVISICPMIRKDSLTSNIPFRIKFDTTDTKENKEAVSERIRYDVDIFNPSDSKDWWVRNIETSKREKFINLILDAGTSGKYRTFDYYNDPISSAELKKTFSITDTIRGQRTTPPYDNIDTVIHKNIIKKDIIRIRFMEEWFYDNNSSSFTKKIKGINPIIQKFDKNTGEFRGNMPLFWIYMDDKYPIKQK